jgi:hypothetical protein
MRWLDLNPGFATYGLHELSEVFYPLYDRVIN